MKLSNHTDGTSIYPDIYLFEVGELHLPKNWSEQLVDMAERRNKPITIDGSHPTSREDGKEKVVYGQIGGLIVQHELPWIFEAYYGELLTLAQQAFGDEVSTNEDPQDVMNVLVHTPGQRGEVHVDNAPASLLLYPQPAEKGGRLFVSPHTQTVGYNNVIDTGIPLQPETSTGILFRGDHYVHVSERNESSIDRVAVNMNYHLPGQSRDPSLRNYSEYNQS